MRPKYFRRTTKVLALVFAKLVSLTQTFDSLGSINASRHVASRKEQAKRRGEARTRVRYPMGKHVENRRIAQRYSKARCNDSYKLRDGAARLYSSRLHFAYFIEPAKVDEQRPVTNPETRSRLPFRYFATKNVTSS